MLLTLSVWGAVQLPTQTAHMESTAEMKEKKMNTHTQNVTLYMPGVQPHH